MERENDLGRAMVLKLWLLSESPGGHVHGDSWASL